MSFDLRLERLIDGAPDEVFEAFVADDAMREWFMDGPDWGVEIRASDLRVGGTTIVAFGPAEDRYVEEMTYTEVDRPNRLAYRERFVMPDGSSYFTDLVVSFEAQDGKTLLTIVQTGFPNAEQRDGHQGGWPGFIDRLERVVVARRTS